MRHAPQQEHPALGGAGLQPGRLAHHGRVQVPERRQHRAQALAARLLLGGEGEDDLASALQRLGVLDQPPSRQQHGGDTALGVIAAQPVQLALAPHRHLRLQRPPGARGHRVQVRVDEQAPRPAAHGEPEVVPLALHARAPALDPGGHLIGDASLLTGDARGGHQGLEQGRRSHALPPCHPGRFAHHHGAAALVGEDLLQERVRLHAAHQVHAGHAAHQRGADGMRPWTAGPATCALLLQRRQIRERGLRNERGGLLGPPQEARRLQQEEELLGAERHRHRGGHRVCAGVVDGARRITRQRSHHGHIVPGAQVLEQARVHGLDVARQGRSSPAGSPPSRTPSHPHRGAAGPGAGPRPRRSGPRRARPPPGDPRAGPCGPWRTWHRRACPAPGRRRAPPRAGWRRSTAGRSARRPRAAAAHPRARGRPRSSTNVFRRNCRT